MNRLIISKTLGQTTICVIIGLVYRLFYCIRYPVQPRDSYTYEYLISQWSKSETLHYNRYPLSLWILKIPSSLFHCDIIKGGIIINMIIGILLIVLTMMTTNKYFKTKGLALIAGTLVATHPTLVHISCCFLRENTYLLFFSLSLVFLLRYFDSKHLVDLLLAGITGAVSFMCRFEGMEIVLIVYVLVFFLLFIKKLVLFKALFHVAAFSTVFFLTVRIICILCDFNTLDIKYILMPLELNTNYIPTEQG